MSCSSPSYSVTRRAHSLEPPGASPVSSNSPTRARSTSTRSANYPLALQAKLLHVLQDFRFSRLGGFTPIDVDARVIAATNRRLEEAMAHGEFREDLYYRLNEIEMEMSRSLLNLRTE
jgi:Sigma-54 interaction domain